MNFNSILIGSEDPQRLVQYYTRLFGEPGMSDGGYSGWQIGSGFLTARPHYQVKEPTAHPGRIIWSIEAPDVTAEFERSAAAGAVVVREPYTMHGAPDFWIATLADPDDNYFQLMSPMPAPAG